MSKPVLGRGLGALLGGGPPKPAEAPAAAPAASEGQLRVSIDRIRPCPFQPRKEFTQEAIRELADSIREQGILQPLVVRPAGDGYELIAGERRWRAAQAAGLSEVPVSVREADDRTVLELALVENLQRENLNPIEEAQGFARLIEHFSLTQEQAAAKVGKGRVVVANALRLLKLSPDVQAYLRDNLLSVGHAKAILGLTSPEAQKLAAERVLRDSLNVRQAEELVAGMSAAAQGKPAPATKKAPLVRDAHVTSLEARIQERVGTKVRLRYRHGRGAIDIQFFNDDDLERVLEILGVSTE